jgi:hypothetical protein
MQRRNHNIAYGNCSYPVSCDCGSFFSTKTTRHMYKGFFKKWNLFLKNFESSDYCDCVLYMHKCQRQKKHIKNKMSCWHWTNVDTTSNVNFLYYFNIFKMTLLLIYVDFVLISTFLFKIIKNNLIVKYFKHQNSDISELK